MLAVVKRYQGGKKPVKELVFVNVSIETTLCYVV
jgi:hypothetical protein